MLPLLELALTELWERRADGCLTHHAYDQIGGVTGGLGQWCDRALDGIDASLHPVARWVVTALVRVGDEAEGGPDSRRRRMMAELGGEGDGAVAEVVRRLTAARLVTSRGQDGGQASMELIHEALLREWVTCCASGWPRTGTGPAFVKAMRMLASQDLQTRAASGILPAGEM